ncbi:unnamed protein product [Oikopleura dioica]|uniref:USP domain-containing protein n=1 Tax=Oikopleura dioica TaxID=34765 RepID=E4XS25_OIKDI|nr:unnamed protein product [Oikopleura dioica]
MNSPKIDSAKKETKTNANSRSRSGSESRREAKRVKQKEDDDADSADEKPSKSAKPQQLRGVTGLKNLGNTCYLNTIVQVLASLKCFRDALKEVEFAVQSPTRNGSDEPADGRSKRNRGVNSLTKSLQQLVGELNAGRRLTVEPSTFVQAVHDQLPNFNGHIQQDVQEFFCQLLYKLEKERTKGCSEDILNCVVNRMFTGQWQSEVICTQCSNSNLQIEKFNTLPLEFPNKYYKNIGSQNKNVSLDFLLKIYTKSERLGRVYNCENCRINHNYGRTRRQSVRTEADKRITVLESPKCLFVHLKRAKYSHTSGQEKIACHVDFPEKLNLTPYMTHKASSPEYVLRAVVVHHGKYFNSGHYTTFCYKDSEKKDGKSSGWVQYNDSEVTGATIADVLASQAYMLLYVDVELANEQDSS